VAVLKKSGVSITRWMCYPLAHRGGEISYHAWLSYKPALTSHGDKSGEDIKRGRSTNSVRKSGKKAIRRRRLAMAAGWEGLLSPGSHKSFGAIAPVATYGKSV